MHPQLKRDLEDKGINLTRVSYFTSLKEFVEARVKPSLQIIELHEKLIEQLKADRSGFMYPLEENLAQKITGLELSGFDIVLEEGERFLKLKLRLFRKSLKRTCYCLFGHRHYAILTFAFINLIF